MSNNIKNDKQKIESWISISKWIFIILGALSLIPILVSLTKVCPVKLLDYAYLGPWGDLVGGIIGTLVAFVSLFIMAKTLLVQLEVNNSVLETNRRNLLDAQYQIFIKTYYDTIKEYISPNGALVGKNALQDVMEEFTNNHSRDGHGGYHIKVGRSTSLFETLYEENYYPMSNHLRSIYFILELLSNHNDPYSEKYAKVFRGQLSDAELLLIRYDCLTRNGFPLRNYVIQYDIFNNFPIMSLAEFGLFRSLIKDKNQRTSINTHFKYFKDSLESSMNETGKTFKVNIDVLRQVSFKQTQENHIIIEYNETISTARNPYGPAGKQKISIALETLGLDNIEELYTFFIFEIIRYSQNRQCTIPQKTKKTTNNNKLINIEVVLS